MSGEEKKRFRKWLYIVLTALGVGSYPAAKCAGCDSGIVDDVSGECVEFDK